MFRASLLVALACTAAASAAVVAGRPGVVLTASPASLAIGSGERRTIRVANAGAEPLVVDVGRAALAVGLTGKPRVVLAGTDGGAASLVTVRPRRLTLAPGASARLTVVSRPARAARPGDHAALVLLQTRAAGATRVAVRMRIGVTVLVRVPGAIRHSLAVRGVRVRRRPGGRSLDVVIANTGNAVEWLRRERLRVVLLVHGRVIARLHPATRELLPGGRGLVEVLYRGPVRGGATARVLLAADRRGGATVRRSFGIRL
jgi:hypothetical protein